MITAVFDPKVKKIHYSAPAADLAMVESVLNLTRLDMNLKWKADSEKLDRSAKSIVGSK